MSTVGMPEGMVGWSRLVHWYRVVIGRDGFSRGVGDVMHQSVNEFVGRRNWPLSIVIHFLRCCVLLMICGFGASSEARAAVAYVQSADQLPDSGNAVSVTYASAQSAGDLNVVFVGWSDTTSTVQSISDTNGNAYVAAIGPTTSSGNATQITYYAKNIAAGANTVTVTFNATVTFPDVRIVEYSGVDAVNPFDVGVGGSGIGATQNSGSITTTNANDVLVASNYIADVTTAADPAYTQRLLTGGGEIIEDRVVTASGSYSASSTQSGADWWVMQLAAFRGASAGGDTQAPTAPTSMTATAVSTTQINLSWTASTDNVGVTRYRVESCQGANCTNFAQISTPTTTTYSVFGLTAATAYTFRVRATDAAANLSAYSNAIGASTPTAGGVSSAVKYDYDSLGRLVQVEIPTLNSVQAYGYDASGNILSSLATPIAALSIGGMSSSQGSPGTQITIYGSGFSPTPGANAVTIGGVTATVVSATTTQLVIAVPPGANSGSLNVTVGGSSVTQVSPFTVTPSTSAPAITSFLPTLGTPGSSITITGSGFDASPANNKIQFNSGPWGSANAHSSTTLGTRIPTMGAWGKIRVLTPHGLSVSATDFFTPPSGYSVTTIGSTGRINVATPATILLPTAGQSSLQVFDANTGDLLTIGASGVTITAATIKIFSPDGALLTSGVITASGQGVQLPQLPMTGTYAVVIDPGSNTGNVTLTLADPLKVSISVGSAPTAITVPIPGQRVFVSFTGSQASFVDITMSAVTVSAARISLFNPDGSVLLRNSLSTAGQLIRPQLPATGTYAVLIDPSGSIGGSLHIAVATSPAPTLTANQAASTLTLASGTTITNTFIGSAGQHISVSIAENGNGTSQANLTIVAPDGSVICNRSMTAGFGSGDPQYVAQGASCDLASLPVNGTYTVLLNGSPGNVFFAFSTPVQATLNPASAPVSVTLPVVGQGLSLNFQATEGSIVSLVNSGQGLFSPSNATAPDGSVVNPWAEPFSLNSDHIPYPTGSSVLIFGPLPLTGIYHIYLQPILGWSSTSNYVVGTITETLSLPLTAGSLAFNDIPTDTSVSRTGQGVVTTFNAAAGQGVALSISESSGGISNGTYQVIGPSGNMVLANQTSDANCQSTSCGTVSTCVETAFPCRFALPIMVPPVSASGTYTVTFLQTEMNTGSIAGTATLSIEGIAPANGTLSVNGAVAPVTITQPRIIDMTFPAAAGQSLTATVSGDLNQIMRFGTFWVIGPDGTPVASRSYCDCNDGNATSISLNVGPLTTSGTYSLILESPYAGTAGFQVVSH